MKSINWRRGRTARVEEPVDERVEERGKQPVKEQVDELDENADLAWTSRAAAGAKGSESWVDATVTLLATIIFGLGWAVVELEGADPLQAGYDQVSQSSGSSGAIDASRLADPSAAEAIHSTGTTRVVAVGLRSEKMWGAERKRWTDMAPPSSKP